MGTYQHHAIVITGTPEQIKKARAQTGPCAIIGPCDTQTNLYTTICVAPDGGKEGGGPSDDGDAARARLREWLEQSDLDWVEVSFGECGSGVTAGSDTRPL